MPVIRLSCRDSEAIASHEGDQATLVLDDVRLRDLCRQTQPTQHLLGVAWRFGQRDDVEIELLDERRHELDGCVVGSCVTTLHVPK